MVSNDLGFGILLNILAHLMIEGLLFLVRKELKTWADRSSAYVNTSIIQLLVIFGAPVLAGIGGSMWGAGIEGNQAGLAAACALVSLAHSLIAAVIMAVVFERRTGVSMLTGKPRDPEWAQARYTPGGSIKQRDAEEARLSEVKPPVPRVSRHPGPKPPPEPVHPLAAARPHMRLPRWTWKATACLAMVISLAVAAWASVNPLLYFPACALLLAMAVEYCMDLYAAAQMPRIETWREVPPVAGEDDVVEVRLVLHNKGGTVNNLALVDHFAAEDKPYRECKVNVGCLPAGATGTFSYEVDCWRRGVWRVGPLELRRESPLAIFKNRAERLESSLIRIYPHLYPSPSWNIALAGARERVGLGTTSKAGWSSEFYGVRDYQPGDPRRLIHWPSTAKCMTPMVKEQEMAVDFDLTAVVDLNRYVVSGEGKHSTFEYMIKIIGEICREMLRRCYSLNVAAMGDGMRILKCARGTRDLPLVLDFLTELQPSGQIPLEVSLDYLNAHLKHDSTLIIPMQRPNPRMVEVLSLLREGGMDPRVLLFDVASFRPSNGEDEVEALVEKTAYQVALEALRSRSFQVAGVNREMGPSRPVLYGGWG